MPQLGGQGYEQFADAALPRLLRLGYVLTGSPDDAWDLTQESLVRIGLAWSRVDQSQNPQAYAERVLIRLNISRWRRLRREVLVGRVADTRIDWSAEDLEIRDELLTALKELGPRQRTVVVLRYYLDLPEEEIAARMNCSTGTVKSQLSRGLRGPRRNLSSAARRIDSSTGGQEDG